MDKLRITGGRALEGTITVSGAKNAALPILCAALLSDRPLRVSNVPTLTDIATMAKLLGRMGVQVERRAGEMTLDSRSITDPTAPYDLVKTMRASVLVLGPLLARCGGRRFRCPAAAPSAPRPVDQHLKGLQAMGAEISIEHGYMEASAARLRGARIVDGHRDGDRHREPDDGRGARRRHDHPGERGARAGGRRSRPLSRRDGREDRRRRDRRRRESRA